ncbi:MAG TPA: hypothetical protein VIW70_18010 [Rubrivivax sp.]
MDSFIVNSLSFAKKMIRDRPDQPNIAFQLRMRRRRLERIRVIHSLCGVVAFFFLTTAQAAVIEFSGGTTQETYLPWGPSKPVVVGVFADNFDPLNPYPPGDICQYGDDVCNLEGDYYVSMVAEMNFIPLGEVLTFGAGTFVGTAVATGIEGRQLWMVLWDQSDKYANSVITTALGNTNWLGMSDGSELNRIDLAEVNTVIFGELQGGLVVFGGLPIPEPSTWTLFLGGIIVVAWNVSTKRRHRSLRLQ